jgi:hypothetical protein
MVISRKMQFSTFEPSQFTFEPAGTFEGGKRGEKLRGRTRRHAGSARCGEVTFLAITALNFSRFDISAL